MNQSGRMKTYRHGRLGEGASLLPSVLRQTRLGASEHKFGQVSRNRAVDCLLCVPEAGSP